ncbi:MAG: enoyl-CoA hydratase/isomerase family protein [Bacillota bacterium]|nr:enoyl-CoA hydratase/isomerase family protein [Bacillota bacterium]
MAYETILVGKNNHVARITLNRPGRLNAINSVMGREINEALADVAGDEEIRVLIITGSPRIREKEGRQEIKHCFSAGWDLSETALVDPFVEVVAAHKNPVIAMINGLALGGGCELALACDFIFAADSAEMGMPEINRGLLPGWGGTQRLPRRIGISRAKKMILSGETVSGEEAARIGLADVVVSREDLDSTVTDFALTLAGKPPLGLKRVKEVINRGMDNNLQTGLKLEQEALGFLIQTEDFREGIAAFLEKREPYWKGC